MAAGPSPVAAAAVAAAAVAAAPVAAAVAAAVAAEAKAMAPVELRVPYPLASNVAPLPLPLHSRVLQSHTTCPLRKNPSLMHCK